MWTPDDIDIHIIKIMSSPHSFQWDVRISLGTVAKGLSMDEETVRKRLHHMNDVGFLQGWQLILNPVLLGRKASIVELCVKDQESKSDVISRLSLMEGVTLIEDFYGNEIAVHILFENEDRLKRQVQLIASICGCPTPISWRLGFPTCRLTPTKTDWRIIHDLRMNARRKLSDVAQNLHLSTRTVKRHMIKLVEGNAFYLDPLLDVRKGGGVSTRFWIVCEADKKKAIDAKFQSEIKRIVSTHTAPQEYSLFIVHCANASEVKEISQWLEKLDGVKEVRSNIDVEHIHVEKWLIEEIDKLLSGPVFLKNRS